MIYHIIKSYFAILLSVGTGAISVFALGLYWILRTPNAHDPIEKSSSDLNNQEDSRQEDGKINVCLDGDDKTSLTLLDEHVQNEMPSSLTIPPESYTAEDVFAIAGDDILSTQLDLARAYIETGKKQLAQKILEQVVDQGSERQQSEARNLLGLI